MKKYIIQWNTGFGHNAEVIEAVDQTTAEEVAYEAWKEEAEMNADYSAEEYSDELAEELCLD